MNDLEMLSAYLDNELNEGQRTALEQRLELEPELQQQLACLKQSDAMARSYFSEINSQPLPLNIEAMILNARAGDQNTQAKPTARILTWPKFKAPSWGLASAASVLLAVGFWMNQSPSVSDIDSKLLSALETVPSGTFIDINAELKIEIIASYQDHQGVVCRYLLEHSPQNSNPAMACFVQGRWQLEKADFGEVYQTASSINIEKEGLMSEEQEQAWLSKQN